MTITLPERYLLDGKNPLLGEGGMGQVFRVRDTILDVPVALKLVRPELAAEPRFRERFDAEIRLAARFAHRRIVPLHDSGELPDGTPFLGLALAEGGNLSRLSKQGADWNELLRLILELLDGLGHIHSRGVLHRDLKPENILLARLDDGLLHVWLADLGLANAAAVMAKRRGRVEGTLGFMAPEQKLGLPREYGPWTDLYAVGVILWDLVTGQLPFDRDQTALDGALPLLDVRPGLVVPAGLELILANLLNPEPLSRYDLCADLRTELLSLGGVESTPTDRDFSSGTVAPSASAVYPGSYLSSRITASRSLSARAQPAALQVHSFPQQDVPVWNRPRPLAMPDLAPGEPGLGARARASLSLFALREMPLVARDDVRDRLWALAAEVKRHGTPRVVFVVGENGSGKTRLAQSVLWALEEGGWAESLELFYQDPAGMDDGYAGAARDLVKPWNETYHTLRGRLARRLSRERGVVDQSVYEESELLCAWAGLGKEGDQPVNLAYGLREVSRYLEARTWRGLSGLLLDDVQFAKEEGDGLGIVETVLESLVDRKEKRLFVIATVSHDALRNDPAFAERFEACLAKGALRVDLPRLDRAGTRAMLREYLTLTGDLAERVVSRCEGNPLFARQLLQEWADRGWLVQLDGSRYGLASGVEIEQVIPTDVQTFFSAQLREMGQRSPKPNRFFNIMHAMALCGRSAPTRLIQAIAGPEMFGFIEATGLIERAGDQLSFHHGLLHGAVLAQSRGRKNVCRLERLLARAWITYGKEADVDVAIEVGKHAFRGKDHALALRFLLKACESAWGRGASVCLEDASRMAVESCENDLFKADKRGWALFWRGRSFQTRGQTKRAERSFVTALKHFESVKHRTGVVLCSAGLGWAALEHGDLTGSARYFSTSLRIAKQQRNSRDEAQAIYGLARVEQQKRNFDGADILFTRVLNRYLQLGDQRGQAMAAMGQGLVARLVGRFDDADELYLEAIDGYVEVSDFFGRAESYVELGLLYRQRLDLVGAIDYFQTAMQITDELGARGVYMKARLGLAQVLRLQGRTQRALKLCDAVKSWAVREEAFELQLDAQIQRAQIALYEGDLDAVYEQTCELADALQRAPGHWLWAPYRLMVATMLALRGDEENTYRWLWSAGELGLGEVVDHDLARQLTIICSIAAKSRWETVLLVSSKLAIFQWSQLKRPKKEKKIRRLITP